jgi:hypothetical protein
MLLKTQHYDLDSEILVDKKNFQHHTRQNSLSLQCGIRNVVSYATSDMYLTFTSFKVKGTTQNPNESVWKVHYRISAPAYFIEKSMNTYLALSKISAQLLAKEFGMSPYTLNYIVTRFPFTIFPLAGHNFAIKLLIC